MLNIALSLTFEPTRIATVRNAFMMSLKPITRMRPVFAVLMAGAVGIAILGPYGGGTTSAVQDEIAAPPSKTSMEKFMARKLAAAQKTLEGVASEDFEQIRKSTHEMIELSRHEAWERMASARFVQDTADFVTAAEFLDRMAEAKDPEGTSLGFVRLTMTCTNCHSHVRTSSVAQLDEHRDSADATMIADAF
jgi:hypothetical protein